MKRTLVERIEHDFSYHKPPSQEVADRHGLVRGAGLACARELIRFCPASRELSTAITKLEEAMFWANAAIARAPEAKPAEVEPGPP